VGNFSSCVLLLLLSIIPCQVMYTFSDWYKTPWDKINVDVLVEETKKLAKDVKTLNKAVRNYEVFRLLEESLKAMLTSLPLVQVRRLLPGGASGRLLVLHACATITRQEPGWHCCSQAHN
jgi:hypothetical protein